MGAPHAQFIHDRVREHLNNGKTSVEKHISKCQTKVEKGIEIKTIVPENDPANLRLFEAFYISTKIKTFPQLPKGMQRISIPVN